MIDFASIIGTINTYVWYVAFVFLVGLGIYFMIRLKGIPILKIHRTSKLALSGTKEGKHSHTVSSFEAFCIGLGARVGVGNIAGVASAIVVGGPGAVFWMWIFAIIGSASSFMESTLSQLFKEKKSDGQFHSGPAYYALKGLGNRKLAVLLAFLIIITFGIGFVGVQATNSATALDSAFSSYLGLRTEPSSSEPSSPSPPPRSSSEASRGSPSSPPRSFLSWPWPGSCSASSSSAATSTESSTPWR